MAMKEQGIGVVPDLHCISRGFNGNDHIQQFIRIFRNSQPTAVLCGIDEDVQSIYQACMKETGTCSFIGFLNEQIPEIPSITYPVLPIKEAGYRAADKILWRIANPHLPYEQIRIKGELHIGESVRKV